MQLQTEMSALSLFDQGIKKSEIKTMADEAVRSVLENGNILQVAEALSAIELFAKEIKDNPEFKEYAREEAGKSPKGYISPSGAKIEPAEVGTSYDYTNCNDPELVDLETEFEKVKAKLDERKNFLKTVPTSGIDIITGEGEAVKVFPPSKSSKSSYKITLAR